MSDEIANRGTLAQVFTAVEVIAAVLHDLDEAELGIPADHALDECFPEAVETYRKRGAFIYSAVVTKGVLRPPAETEEEE